jgi:ribosomal protein L3
MAAKEGMTTAYLVTSSKRFIPVMVVDLKKLIPLLALLRRRG